MKDDISSSDILNAASNIYAALLVSHREDQNYNNIKLDLLKLSIDYAYQMVDRIEQIETDKMDVNEFPYD